MIKPAYSVSFLLSINIFVWQNVLYFPNDPSTNNIKMRRDFVITFAGDKKQVLHILIVRLDAVEIARVPDILSSLFPSWSG